MKLRKYTLQDLKEAIKTSITKRQVLEKLNIIPAGGNYATLAKAIEYFQLDISHFKGRGWNKGRVFGPKRPIEVYLSNEFAIQTFKLKNRLLKEGIFDHKCTSCNLEEWLNKPIPLEIHHIDGNSSNNNLKNLQLLCPNCHALTDNYRGKNKQSK